MRARSARTSSTATRAEAEGVDEYRVQLTDWEMKSIAAVL
jgi:hypothetical protein